MAYYNITLLQNFNNCARHVLEYGAYVHTRVGTVCAIRPFCSANCQFPVPLFNRRSRPLSVAQSTKDAWNNDELLTFELALLVRKMTEPLVVAAMSLPRAPAWERLNMFVANLFPGVLCQPWQRGVADTPLPQCGQRVAQSVVSSSPSPHQSSPTAPSVWLAVHEIRLDMSVLDFWNLHDEFRHTTLMAPRAALRCATTVERVVRCASRHNACVQFACIELPQLAQRGGPSGATMRLLAAAVARTVAPNNNDRIAMTVFSALLRGNWSQFCGMYQRNHAAVARANDGGGPVGRQRVPLPMPTLHVVWLRIGTLFEHVRRWWNYRINALAATRQALLHENALISTLGGGYFMCVCMHTYHPSQGIRCLPACCCCKVDCWYSVKDIITSIHMAVHLRCEVCVRRWRERVVLNNAGGGTDRCDGQVPLYRPRRGNGQEATRGCREVAGSSSRCQVRA